MLTKHLALTAIALATLTACQTTAHTPPAALAPRPSQTQPSAPTSPGAPAPVPTAPVAATAPSSLASPELIAALRQLTDDDFKTRQQAVATLEQMMARQFQQMVALQQLMLQIQDGLTEQLRLMTQTTDPESQVRIAGLFEFNAALSRFAIDAIDLPKEQSDRMLAWGLKAENLPLIARAYHRRDEIRGRAAADIGKIPGPEADWVLLQLLSGNSREVSLMAMDAMYDRPANAPATQALWERAIAGLRQYDNRNSNRTRVITVRHRTISIYDDPNSRSQDADIAVDVLVKQKDPLVVDLLNKLFTDLASSVNSPNDYRWRALSPNYGGDSGRAIGRLIEAFKPQKAVPFLIKTLAVNHNDGSDTNMNNEKMRYSSRVDFAAMLILSIGQDPEDYNLKKYANWGDRWLLKGAMPEEEALVKKLQEWWREHAADYGETTPAAKSAVPEDGAATKAAEKEAAKAAARKLKNAQE